MFSGFCMRDSRIFCFWISCKQQHIDWKNKEYTCIWTERVTIPPINCSMNMILRSLAPTAFIILLLLISFNLIHSLHSFYLDLSFSLISCWRLIEMEVRVWGKPIFFDMIICVHITQRYIFSLHVCVLECKSRVILCKWYVRWKMWDVTSDRRVPTIAKLHWFIGDANIFTSNFLFSSSISWKMPETSSWMRSLASVVHLQRDENVNQPSWVSLCKVNGQMIGVGTEYVCGLN